jgi:hypothetical protein
MQDWAVAVCGQWPGLAGESDAGRRLVECDSFGNLRPQIVLCLRGPVSSEAE